MGRQDKKYKKNPLNMSAIDKIADELKLELPEREKLHLRLENLDMNFSVEETFGKLGASFAQTQANLRSLLKAITIIKKLHDDVADMEIVSSQIAEVLLNSSTRHHTPAQREILTDFRSWLAHAGEVEKLVVEALNKSEPSGLHLAVKAMTVSRFHMVQEQLIPLWKELTGKDAGVSRKEGSAYLTESSKFIASCIAALGLRSVGAEGVATLMKKRRN